MQSNSDSEGLCTLAAVIQLRPCPHHHAPRAARLRNRPHPASRLSLGPHRSLKGCPGGIICSAILGAVLPDHRPDYLALPPPPHCLCRLHYRRLWLYTASSALPTPPRDRATLSKQRADHGLFAAFWMHSRHCCSVPAALVVLRKHLRCIGGARSGLNNVYVTSAMITTPSEKPGCEGVFSAASRRPSALCRAWHVIRAHPRPLGRRLEGVRGAL